MKKNEIFVKSGKNYKEMTKELLVKADLVSHLGANKEQKIGIKPNLVSETPAFLGATTHPEVVCGIIEYLQENDYKNIVILEGSWVGGRTVISFRECGYEEISSEYGAPLIDTQADKGVKTDCRGMEISICESVSSVDFLINVPVLKGHCQTRMTCALKNMKGLIPNSEKRRFHTLGLHEPIAHLNAGLHQDFIVVDNICGDPVSEDGGSPYQTDRVYVGIDPVLIDSFGCSLLGRDVNEVRYIRLSEQLMVGSTDLSTAVIDGISRAEMRGDASLINNLTRLSSEVEDIDSCSACYAHLMPALERLEEEGLLSRLNEKVCIGQGYRGKCGRLGVGACTAGFENTAKGCPPTEEEMYNFLRKYIESNN